MHVRQLLLILITLALVVTVGYAVQQGRVQTAPIGPPQAQLENVRDYAAGVWAGAPDYAIDGGLLYVGNPGYWQSLPLPEGVIASAIDVVATEASDGRLPRAIVYVGAANELAIYRSDDQGLNWLRGQLTHDVVHGNLVGGVTDLAVDPIQRLVYVGTDTAGLFRVRDTGAQLMSTAHLLLSEPVRQVVTDRTGSGLAFMRTEWALYRARDFGLKWEQVDNFQSLPTALAMSYDPAPVVFVGTVDRGLLRSHDGRAWVTANRGLPVTPAARLYIDALTVDPLQPAVIYVAVSQLAGDSHVRRAASRVAQSRDGGVTWVDLDATSLNARVTDLLPVSGAVRGVYALTLRSRTPQPLGNAPVIHARADVQAAPPPAAPVRSRLAWLVAGLAGVALLFALAVDLATRPQPAPATSLRVQVARIRRIR